MLACRNCRIPLDAKDGCIICNPIRKHLVVVGDHEQENPGLVVTGNEIVAALRGQVKHIRSLLKSTDEREAMDAEKRLLAVANTASKMLESSRKLQQDGVAAIENMNFAKKAELFINWIMELAPAYRSALREKWDQWELEVSKPLSQLKEGTDDL
jgi:uncharacterized Zn finger protein (UPF0148 family)